MKYLKVLFFSSLFTVLYCCNDTTLKEDPGKLLYNQYCTTCHMASDPKNLTKDIWSNSVLPRMGWRLGIKDEQTSPFKGLNTEELSALKSLNIYPEEAIISDEEWALLKSYVINLAPDIIPFDSTRIKRAKNSSLFSRFEFPLDNIKGSKVTAIEYNSAKKEFWFADFYKKVFHWSTKGNINIEMANTVVDFSFNGDSVLLTQIGKLFPTNQNLGTISLISNNRKQDIIQNLRRPVQSDFCDLNNNKKQEVIIAEYGNQHGGLSFYTQKDNEYIKTELLEKAGAIKFEIEDLTKNDKKDIIALFAQGDESIYLFKQKDSLSFESELLLRFPPEYGTSDFVLKDIDGDGDKDIITAHGDNADISYFSKPYHGIRIFINENNTFSEKAFIPIYGATKVRVEDFDRDNDLDIVVSCFFPDMNKLIHESFIYLNNISEEILEFEIQTIKSDIPIRSLSMELADFDGDNDKDILLGLFDVSPQSIPSELNNKWQNAPFDIVVITNNLDSSL